jgi:hypothetical protein
MNLLDLRLVAGFVVIVFSAALIDKLGNVMYRRGIAKPFFVLGHRLHHRNVLRTVLPGAYVTTAALIYEHYLRIVWYSFWPSAEVAMLLSGVCFAFDMALDGLSGKVRRMAHLPHEWLYLVVPMYVFTHLVTLV